MPEEGFNLIKINRRLLFSPSSLLLVCALCPLALRADVIFDNLTSPIPLGFAVTGSAVPTPIGGCCQPSASAAESFTPAAAYSMTEAIVDVAGAVGYDSDFDLSLFSDNSGLPGTSIETLGTDLHNNFGEVTVDSFSPISLNSGTTYWLVMTPHDSGSSLGWSFGGSSSAPAATSNYEATTWNSQGNQTAQFEIEGTLNAPPPPPVTTPEPSPLPLLAAAGVMLLAFRARLVRRTR